MTSFLQDLRYAARTLARSPGFTAVAVLTLALGIGASTAIFSVVHSVLLRPLPYGHPETLRVLWGTNSREQNLRNPMSYLDYVDLSGSARSFERMAAVSPGFNAVLALPQESERLTAQFATASLLPLLEVQPALGRWFLPEEDRAGAAPTAVLSHELWGRRFAAAPSIVGQSITLNGQPTRVIGVMPPRFQLFAEAEVWQPMAVIPFGTDSPRTRGVRFLNVVGRLRPGVPDGVAQAEAESVAAGLANAYPAMNAGFSTRVVDLTEEITGKAKPALLVLFGAVGLLLAAACANVANLLLARGAARRGEMAVRSALGASRGRLVRLLLTESSVLALVAAAAGCLLAVWLVELIQKFFAAAAPRLAEASVSGPALIFALAAAILTGLLFGLAPSLQSTGRGLAERLNEGVRAGRRGNRLRQALLGGQIALAVVLLAGATLLLTSFARLLRVDGGFRREGLLTLQLIVPPPLVRDAATGSAFYRRLFSELSSLPGVLAAGATTRLPLRESISTRLEVEGAGTPESERPEVEFRRASPAYYTAMGVPLEAGRFFTDNDGIDAPPLVLINEAAARRFWPGKDPIGQRLRYTSSNPDPPWSTVIGVVGNMRHFGLDAAPRPEIAIPVLRVPPVNPLLALRTGGDPRALVASVRARLRSIDPGLVTYNIATMDELVDASVASRRFPMLLLTALAVLSLALAAAGVFSVVSLLVAQRQREVGIRMALGARPSDILRLILGQGVASAAAGAGAGLLLALAAGRVLEGQLYGITARDPLSLLGTAVLVCLVATLASAPAAIRAARLHPTEALRHD